MLCRNLRIAFFSQHHVDQLVMDVSALEFMQQKFPGIYRHGRRVVEFECLYMQCKLYLSCG